MHVFFSVGEPSGDQHAAHLIQELQRRQPGIRFSGLGGPLMERAGCELHYRLTDLAVMGVLRVIPMLWRFYTALRLAGRVFREERPDAVMLVDFPGFNWWVARRAKAYGIRVFYYMPPQLWAWAPWRIRRVRRFVDHVLCALPFEQQWYCRRGAAAEYVGHPFFDEIAERQLDNDFLERWPTNEGRLVGVLPGSRRQEVEHNWPLMLTTIQTVATRFPDARFLVACYSEVQRTWCEEVMHRSDWPEGQHVVQLFVGKTPEVIQAADCCLMVSGSVSLEMLARRKPAIVVYYLDWMLTLVIPLMVRCKYASLPNLIADREILPEFFPRGNGRREMQRVTAKLISWLADDAERNIVAAQLNEIHAQTVKPGAIGRAAEAILVHLGLPPMRHAA